MPKQKDLKRLVRARMVKTGEAYTTAKLQLTRKVEPEPDYARLAGMSDAAVSSSTGRSWKEWVGILDAAQAAQKPHREITRYVSSLGTPDWWTQMVTVGYERIRGLRDKRQRRDGGYAASKSRTYAVPVATLYKAFANTRTRRRWLPANVVVRSASPEKSMRLTWEDGTRVAIGFVRKGAGKSVVAITHEKLPDKAAVAKVKAAWGEHFDKLGELLP